MNSRILGGIIHPASRLLFGPAGNCEALPRIGHGSAGRAGSDHDTLAGSDNDTARAGVMHACCIGKGTQGNHHGQGQSGPHCLCSNKALTNVCGGSHDPKTYGLHDESLWRHCSASRPYPPATMLMPADGFAPAPARNANHCRRDRREQNLSRRSRYASAVLRRLVPRRASQRISH
jgi:hypothetical protein